MAVRGERHHGPPRRREGCPGRFFLTNFGASALPMMIAGAAGFADGLVIGLQDHRFEVRRACAAALAKLARTTAIGPEGQPGILGAVDRELSFGKLIWERRVQHEAILAEECFDEFLADRAQVGLEYVFVLCRCSMIARLCWWHSVRFTSTTGISA